MRRRGSKSFNRIVKTNLKYQTKEFFSNSTLHGVRYIAEKGRSFPEKFMWFCIVVIASVAALVIIASLWEKFQTNPTITGLDTDFHDQELDFPTVTICPNEPYNSTIVNETAYSFVGGYEVDSDLNIPMLQALTKLSYDKIDLISKLASEIPTSMHKYWSKQTLRYWAFAIADTCESIIESCKFRKNLVPSCCDDFKPIYSERGFCYSFNARYYGTENSEEKLLSFNLISETDKSWSLDVKLKKESKVYIHSVEEVFSYDFRPQFIWEIDSSIQIQITMKQTYTTEDVKQLSVTQRKCIFPDTTSDYEITYYKNDKYSLSACMKECRMKSALKLCKCIPPFYAPANTRDYKHCTLADLSCLSQYAVNITNIGKCSSCKLSCFNTVYDIEKVSRAETNNMNEGRFHIEFLTWPIIRYKREILFGWVDLLVSFGGIAGLFLGFSLLSAIELVYYFTIRASCMIYKNRQELYELQKEEDRKPFAKYDMSLQPKFKRSEKRQSLATNIKMIQPVDAHSSYYSSSTNDVVDQFGLNESSLRIPLMNVKDTKHGILPSFNDSDGKINTRLLNNRVDGKMNELHSNYIDKQVSFTQTVMSGRKFQRFSNAPYATNIRSLDKNYKHRSLSEEPSLFYHGYMP